MKKLLILTCAITTFSLASGAAIADNIKGKLGVTGKMGLLLPSDGHYGPYKNETDAGFLMGGGLIYGIDDHFAAEIDITHGVFDSNIGDLSVTNISMGAQYRLALDQSQLVPYVGAGLDILMADADGGRDIDTTLGAHVSGGMDYFLTKQLALTAETKLVVAPDADINGPYGEQGKFDPTSLSATFGVRYFFN